ncbi:uncharacterized protein AMSG_04271 [Thecamonas trahens ATCC 50062]|uniref:Uncharacterized protein n=1 Tax=Thecamonas trahens ATCC 50062 TaxID=461836 RepID=A0A0L0D9R0_THETB|nr:hypothetical protein AMSG_04271 [Thecamonas trahens ATCC 50062]KNC48038.1 hypothetical protein AMSG_04271 [Thecamonas trahens ATCC 50062]|eukprot:XP_013759053.1 hypothetical protein AMSG_04271 [Thecamonas trahens ATCC 50062]
MATHGISYTELMAEYNDVMGELKKRNVKPAAISEAAGRLEVLARRVGAARTGAPYLAMVLKALAKCEAALGSGAQEAAAYVTGGVELWRHVTDAARRRVGSVDSMALDAFELYSAAISIYVSARKHALAAALFLDMAFQVHTLGEHDEALGLLAKAADMVSRSLPVGETLSFAVIECENVQVDLLVAAGEYELAAAKLDNLVALLLAPSSVLDAPLKGAALNAGGAALPAAEAAPRVAALVRGSASTPSLFSAASSNALSVEALDFYSLTLVDAYIARVLLSLLVGDTASIAGLIEAVVILSDSACVDPVVADLLDSLARALDESNVANMRLLAAELWPMLNESHVRLLSEFGKVHGLVLGS